MHDAMLKLFEMQINALIMLMKEKPKKVVKKTPERNALGGPGPIPMEDGGLVE